MSLLLALAALTKTPVDAGPAIDPATLTELRHITNNCAWWRTAQKQSEVTTVVTKHDVRMPGKALRLHYGSGGNVHVTDAVGLSGRAHLVVDGAVYPVTWAGEPTITIPKGEQAISDPLPASAVAQAGQAIYSVWEAQPGHWLPTGYTKGVGAVSARYKGQWGGQIHYMSSNLIAGSPLGIYGLTTPQAERPKRSVLLMGDSMLEIGWARHAVDSHGHAWADMAEWLAPIAQQRSDLANRILQTGRLPFDVVFTELGVNNDGGDLATQQAAHISMWRWLQEAGLPVAASTNPARTRSTDSWKTVEGQTVDSEKNHANRSLRNDWMRDGAPITPAYEPLPTGTSDPTAVRIGDPLHPVKYPVFDFADATMTSRNSGIWKVDGGAWTTDGTHMNSNGSARVQAAFEQWVADNLT